MKPQWSRWRTGLAGAVLIMAGFLAWQAWTRHLWPTDVVRSTVGLPIGTYGGGGRLIAYPGKVEMPCPRQDETTAVILAIGQSNVANHAATRVTSRYPGAVLNFSEGRCYAAASPLLGATGEQGEFLTLLADHLVADGSYNTVVLVPLGVGSSSIVRWRRGGDLNAMLLPALGVLQAHYRVTEVVWHQGESDYLEGTANDYVAAFDSLAGTLQESGIRAPIFTAIATKCGDGWRKDSPTAEGQRAILDRADVYLGVDTDTLLDDKDRRDGCHLAASGQEKTAAAFARAIEKRRSAVPR